MKFTSVILEPSILRPKPFYCCIVFLASERGIAGVIIIPKQHGGG